MSLGLILVIILLIFLLGGFSGASAAMGTGMVTVASDSSASSLSLRRRHTVVRLSFVLDYLWTSELLGDASGEVGVIANETHAV